MKLVTSPALRANAGTSTRRDFVACGVGAVLWSCASDDGGPRESGPESPAPGSCTVYPEQVEGPFYVAEELLRSDIREGKPGVPLSLELVVVRARDCAPLASVPVDIWHCDAQGVYSGYPDQLGGLDTTGQVFLRGTQLTDAAGRVRFDTIYPGWYPGRTTHIHFKVHPSRESEATSQLYFGEALNAEIHATEAYAARGPKDTSNAADAIAGAVPLLATERAGGGYQASLTVAVAI